MKIYNNTSYKYKAIIDGKEYDFNQKSTLSFDCREHVQVVLKCRNRSSVHLNWLDIIIGVFFGDSTVATLYCDYSFQIQDCNECTITINSKAWNPREQLGIYYCYADTNITNENYIVSDISRIKRKHRNLHLFVSSLLPVGIVFLILCFLTNQPAIFIILFVFWLLIYGLPGIKEIKRFKKDTEPEYINQKLCTYANYHRKGGTNYDETTSKTGRFVSKVLNKMFKFDEEKE